ncbi:ATP-dependent zinc protease family protein [Croceiramulus getboli]|nr:RimK/LysX family protein [Flavobacteriaceae bacterium YJPT1-3]
MSKQIIGRKDRVDFPALGLEDIDVKIDTGAYTSSIHCMDIHEKEGVLHATFLDPKHPKAKGEKMTFDAYDIAAVKSSNGEIQYRYAIASNIRIFGKKYKISLTLTSREDMRFPVLLGRKFLTHKFIVDTSLTDVSFSKKNS